MVLLENRTFGLLHKVQGRVWEFLGNFSNDWCLTKF